MIYDQLQIVITISRAGLVDTFSAQCVQGHEFESRLQ